jgi:integrase
MRLLYRQLLQWTRWLHQQSYTRTDIGIGLDLARFTPRSEVAHDPRAPIVPRHLIPNRAAITALAAAMRGTTAPWWGLATEIAGTVGPRYGELAAMDLDAVDLEAGTIAIRRAMLTVPKSEAHPAGWKWGTPKNRQLRAIPILAAWRPELEARMAEVARDQRLGGNPAGLLFPSVTGKPYRNSNWHAGTYRQACDALSAGVWTWTWHGLRHAAATFLLRAPGMDPVDASTILGHATVSFTMDTYAGVESDYLTRSAGLLDAAMQP